MRHALLFHLLQPFAPHIFSSASESVVPGYAVGWAVGETRNFGCCCDIRPGALTHGLLPVLPDRVLDPRDGPGA